MGRNKHKKYAQNSLNPIVIELGKPFFEKTKGKWSTLFGNENPLVLELACGNGEYATQLAHLETKKNFIGVDIKGSRIWKGGQYTLTNQLKNVAFLRANITTLANYFNENEITEIWLTFPDPRPRLRDEKHRLTNPTFMALYAQLLKHDGWFRFKTDNTTLFDYTLMVISKLAVSEMKYTYNLYESPFVSEQYGIKTKYENIWLQKGETIKYLKCRF